MPLKFRFYYREQEGEIVSISSQDDLTEAIIHIVNHISTDFFDLLIAENGKQAESIFNQIEEGKANQLVDLQASIRVQELKISPKSGIFL